MIHQALRNQFAPLPPLDSYGYNSKGELINQLDPIIYPEKKKPGQSHIKEYMSPKEKKPDQWIGKSIDKQQEKVKNLNETLNIQPLDIDGQPSIEDSILDYANEQEKLNHQLTLKRIIADEPSLDYNAGQDSLMMDESKVLKETASFRPRKRRTHH